MSDELKRLGDVGHRWIVLEFYYFSSFDIFIFN